METTSAVLEPEEHATGWMTCVQQGTIPFEVIVTELPDLSLPELEILLKAARTGKLSIRNRSMAVMGYMRGIASAQICSFLQISTGSLFRYVRAYRKGGSTELLTRKERSDKQSNNEEIKVAVFALLHSPPSAHGVNWTTWTIAELQKILSTGPHPAGAEAIRTIIRKSGFKWRHARIVLTSHDPDYRTKVEAITKLLSELQDDEAFCSIDEYGPFAVKIKGGKKRVAPGEQYVVPQRQRSKGWMILAAALELKRNQVTHFYSRKKDTNEMIRMADTLGSEYRSCRTIYLSWDAASWHVSKRLFEHLEAVNLEAPVQGFPVVKLLRFRRARNSSMLLNPCSAAWREQLFTTATTAPLRRQSTLLIATLQIVMLIFPNIRSKPGIRFGGKNASPVSLRNRVTAKIRTIKTFTDV